jgi:hypothetical protein
MKLMEKLLCFMLLRKTIYGDVVFELESQGLDLNITDDEGKTRGKQICAFAPLHSAHVWMR